MAQAPDGRVSAALALIDQARNEGRAGRSTQQAAEAFLFLVSDLDFQVSGVSYHSYREEEGVQFANRDVLVSISWNALDPVQPVRLTFVFTAVWYLVFALPLFFFTPDKRGTGKGQRQAVRDGLRQLRDSFRAARRYTPIFRFLLARMVYMNGLATMFAFGGVYEVGTFDMTERDVVLFGIALNISAGLGAFAFAWVDDWIGSKRTILISLIGLLVLTTLILMVKSSVWFWALGIPLGIFFGPAQAAGRTFLARVGPEHLQNELFGLESLAGKATAFLGPLLVGWITYWTGSQRLGMSTILVFFAAGFALLLTVRGDSRTAEKPTSTS